MTSYSPRQREPSGPQTTSPSSQRFPSVSETTDPLADSPKRRPSFSFLRRAKSIERFVPGRRRSSATGGLDEPSRKVSNGKLTKRSRSIRRKQEMEREQIPPCPPQIPQMPKPPQLQSFGGDEGRPNSVAIMSGQGHVQRQNSIPVSPMSGANGYPHVPIPPIPTGPQSRNPSLVVDPYARTESMTHRGRYSYASSIASTPGGPRRVRRRKDPTPFNVLIIGARSSGKTSFLNFLKDTLALQQSRKPSLRPQAYPFSPESPQTMASPAPSANFPSYTPHYLENEIDGERIGITLYDSKGLEAHILDLQLREMSSFIESKFEETFSEENKVVRSPGIKDTHIHCVLLLLDPSKLDANLATAKKRGARKGMVMNLNGNSFFDNRDSTTMSATKPEHHGGLDENLDLQVLRTLQGKTTVVPVISKADTITGAHMRVLKKAVYDSIKQANLDTLSALGLDDTDLNEDDEDADSDILPATMKSNGISSSSKANGTHLLSPRTVNHQRSLSNTSHLSSPSNSPSQSDNSASNSNSTTSFKTSDFEIPNPPGSGLPPSNTPHQQHPANHHNHNLGHLSSPPTKPIPPTPAEQTATMATTPFIPLSIISPDPYEPEIIGRRFAWGFADPMDPSHCDFLRLKDSVFGTWRQELRDVSSTGREGWYESWRSERLGQGGMMKIANEGVTPVGRMNGILGGGGGGSGGVGVAIGGGGEEDGGERGGQGAMKQEYGRAW